MAEGDPARLGLAELRRLAEAASEERACPTCAALDCAGWESLPGAFDLRGLRRVGTLRDPEVEEPTLEEGLPAGVHLWDAGAPVDPGWFPYNRCEVWACRACARPFLRYTEYGGYYVDERIRELRAEVLNTSG